MAPRRRKPDLESNTAPDLLRDDEQRRTPPDSVAPRDEETPSAYEREIERLDAAMQARI